MFQKQTASSNKLVVIQKDNYIISALFEERELVQISIEEAENTAILGNIYIGKVKNIVKNINAAFVQIADQKICYLPLAECTLPIFKNKHTTDTIKPGDELFVQVSKEDVKTKAPVVTTKLNFSGKYLILVHGKSMVGISSKIEDEAEKKRLKTIVTKYLTKQYGFIVRTNACYVKEAILKKEADILIRRYENLLKTGIYHSCFSLIYKTLPAFLCAIRDEYSEYLFEIVTDNLSLHEQIKEYLAAYQIEDFEKLRLNEEFSLDRIYNISTKLSEALKEKVWLKSGATLIIQPTEALTVIDVNTGKAINGRKQVQETFYKINLEAAKEIAKQIRLRNLSGIILIDFINMNSEEYKQELLNTLRNYVKADPIKTTVVDMTALELVELTRKKVRKPLYEQAAIISNTNKS